MNVRLILRFQSVLLLVICFFMFLSTFPAFVYNEQAVLPSFLIPIAVTAAAALAVFGLTRGAARELTSRDTLLMVAGSWLTASAVGALPAYLSGVIPSYADAYFETMSGFTTTGATILSNIEAVPRTILFWRSMTHWLGGMGIIVLTVAIFPLLGFRGFQLAKAEAPWSTVDKITPKVTHMAKILWVIYIGLTVLETVLLYAGGMSLFDALTHTFGTVATGGFSPKNASVGFYNSAYIDAVITVFMLLAGVNFVLYFKLLTGRPASLVRDAELKAYLGIFAVSTLVAAVPLIGKVYDDFGTSLRYAAFQTASILTTTGFVTTDYELWPALSQTALFLLMFVGGSAGSTAGGVKVTRIVTLFKQGVSEMKHLLHPHGVFTINVSGMPVRRNMVLTVASFVFLYILLLLLTTVVLASQGASVYGAFTGSLALLGNIGPGMAELGPVENYRIFPAWVKWFMSFIMMTGRLEIFTVLTLFTPWFWKR